MKKLLLMQCFLLAAALCLAAPSLSPAADSGLMEPIGAVGDYMNDAGTTAEIKARIAAKKGLDVTQIHVTTTDSVVTLEGTVDTEDQYDAAELVARRMSNVKGVKNNLKIRQ